jgi:enterochelin esterase-like enzyme
MRPFLALLAILGCVSCGTAQTFQAFLNRVNSVPDSLRGAIVDSFMNAAGSFPYIEGDTLTHFIYRGTATAATVPGDANNWNAAQFAMTRISGTDLWYYSRVFESDARLDYKFVLNGSSWILDPRNPLTCTGGYGPNSELRMPAYIPAPEIEYSAGIPHGTMQDTSFFSVNLNNSRTVRVYLPPNYNESGESYPFVLVHDGLEYVSLAHMDRVLDNLIAQHRIQPVIGVFVPPVNRTAEYAGDQMDEFEEFIVSELVQWLGSNFRIRTEAESHATLGASNGGNISLWLGVQHPEIFGSIAAQSSNVVTAISSRLADDPPLALRFYLDLGTYDIPALIPMVRELAQILQQQDYEYRYYEYHEGHSWGNWRAHIDNALEMFFPGDSVSAMPASHVPAQISFLGSYPNPFNATTIISFTVATPQHVSMQVFDVQGRLVATLIDSPLTVGVYDIPFDGRSLSSGAYFCQLASGAGMLTHKLMLVK